MTATCPHCGWRYEREEGYWLSAAIVNMAVTEAIFGILFVIVVITTLPHVPWLTVLIVGAVANIVVPLGFYPMSKTVWVAIDVYFRQHPVL